MSEPILHFVTSTSWQARLAHLGSGPHAACGLLLLNGHRVSADMPADRAMCRRCADIGTARGDITDAEADVLLAHLPLPRGYHELVTLLRDGHADAAIAIRLGVSYRTLGRRIAAAMREVGARTRFDFGYRVAQAAI